MMIVGIMHTRCKTNRFGLTKERMFTETHHSPSHVIFIERGVGVGWWEADALNVIMAVHAPVLLHVSWKKLPSSSGGQTFVESLQSRQNAKR